ncbi:MAG: hypothetical protein ACRDRO_25630 [Pseudonocardiaceae bacterium]
MGASIRAPHRGQPLIARGEAGVEAGVRKTLGDTNGTPQRGGMRAGLLTRPSLSFGAIAEV